jgi:hypothetical protein
MSSDRPKLVSLLSFVLEAYCSWTLISTSVQVEHSTGNGSTQIPATETPSGPRAVSNTSDSRVTTNITLNDCNLQIPQVGKRTLSGPGSKISSIGPAAKSNSASLVKRPEVKRKETAETITTIESIDQPGNVEAGSIELSRTSSLLSQ